MFRIKMEDTGHAERGSVTNAISLNIHKTKEGFIVLSVSQNIPTMAVRYSKPLLFKKSAMVSSEAGRPPTESAPDHQTMGG